jgi:hypothetical protein
MQVWSSFLNKFLSNSQHCLTSSQSLTLKLPSHKDKCNLTLLLKAMRDRTVSETSSTTLLEISYLFLFKCLVLIQVPETTWLKLKTNLSYLALSNLFAINLMTLRPQHQTSLNNTLASNSFGRKSLIHRLQSSLSKGRI